MIGLPIIGAGGVWTDADVESMLGVGAMAVETDTQLWVPKAMRERGASRF
jgi:NAD(P)H-dependent flavin oxidoreductase YrpB (nitropropane dioxygenase family)